MWNTFELWLTYCLFLIGSENRAAKGLGAQQSFGIKLVLQLLQQSSFDKKSLQVVMSGVHEPR